jgi:hypothetical protein
MLEGWLNSVAIIMRLSELLVYVTAISVGRLWRGRPSISLQKW